MSHDIFQAPSDAPRGVHRNNATVVVTGSQQGTGLHDTQVDGPYDDIIDEYEMPDGEIVQRSDVVWRAER